MDKALAAAGGGAVRVAVVPTEAAAGDDRVRAAQAPAGTGRRPEQPVSQGIQWIALGVDSPAERRRPADDPGEDAEAAGKLHDLIETGFRSPRRQPGFPKDASVEMIIGRTDAAGGRRPAQADRSTRRRSTELARRLAPVLERQRRQGEAQSSREPPPPARARRDPCTPTITRAACRPSIPTTSSRICKAASKQFRSTRAAPTPGRATFTFVPPRRWSRLPTPGGDGAVLRVV